MDPRFRIWRLGRAPGHFPRFHGKASYVLFLTFTGIFPFWLLETFQFLSILCPYYRSKVRATRLGSLQANTPAVFRGYQRQVDHQAGHIASIKLALGRGRGKGEQPIRTHRLHEFTQMVMQGFQNKQPGKFRKSQNFKWGDFGLVYFGTTRKLQT